MATAPHEQQSATLLYFLTVLTQQGVRRSREENWKQRIRRLQTVVPDVRNIGPGGKHRTPRANHDVQVRFQDRRRGRPSERIAGDGNGTMKRTV